MIQQDKSHSINKNVKKQKLNCKKYENFDNQYIQKLIELKNPMVG